MTDNHNPLSPRGDIQLVGSPVVEGLLRDASLYAKRKTNLDVYDKWLHMPGFYRIRGGCRNAVYRDALEQNLLMFRGPQLRVYAVPMLFGVGWASTFLDDDEPPAFVTMRICAYYLHKYLRRNATTYVDFDYCSSVLESYGFSPSIEFYIQLNRVYSLAYDASTEVIQGVP